MKQKSRLRVKCNIYTFFLVWCFSGAHTHQALGATAVDITQAPPPKIGFESNQRGPSSRLDSLRIVIHHPGRSVPAGFGIKV